MPPYAWSISVGALPPGLTVTTGGSVSGTPTAAGTFAFTVHVVDTVAGSAIVKRSIPVAPYLAVSGSCSSPQCNVEQECVTICGAFGSQSGGVAPFSYTVTGGALPTGMGLSGLSLTGAFPPETVGAAPQPWRFQVTVSDSLGASSNVTAVFHVFPHIALTSGSCAGGTGVVFTCAMPFAGGSKAVSGALVKGTLPPGAQIGVDPVNMQLLLTIPAQKTSAIYTADLTVTDSSPCGPSASCTSAPATETIRV